jgi:hypothetical protein
LTENFELYANDLIYVLFEIYVQDDGLQFLKEEKTEDTICSVYLKKVCYHSTLSDQNNVESPKGASKSTFYADLPVSDSSL